jgi:hypothetical protein
MDTQTNKPNVKLQVLPRKPLTTNRLNQKIPKNYFHFEDNVQERGVLDGLVCPISLLLSSSSSVYLSQYIYLWQDSIKQSKKAYFDALPVDKADKHHELIKSSFQFVYFMACQPFPPTTLQLTSLYGKKSINVGRLVLLRKIGIVYKHQGGGWSLTPSIYAVIKLINDNAITIFNNRIELLMQNDTIL